MLHHEYGFVRPNLSLRLYRSCVMLQSFLCHIYPKPTGSDSCGLPSWQLKLRQAETGFQVGRRTDQKEKVFAIISMPCPYDLIFVGHILIIYSADEPSNAVQHYHSILQWFTYGMIRDTGKTVFSILIFYSVLYRELDLYFSDIWKMLTVQKKTSGTWVEWGSKVHISDFHM